MLSAMFRFSVPKALLATSSKNASLLDKLNLARFANAQHVAKLSTTAASNAGHSHWQNIKKQKTEGDRSKSIQFGRYSVSIKIAIRDGNSANPETNTLLSEVIKKAIADGMPKASVQRVIERNSSKSGVLSPTHYEVKLASGAYAVVEAITNRPVMTRSLLISISKKYGFQLVVDSAQSSARRLFEHVGVVRVYATDRIPNLDAATELAIQVGANDVHETEISQEELDEEEAQQKVASAGRSKSVAVKSAAAAEPVKSKRIFEFTCEPRIVSQVRSKLEEQQLVVRSAEDEFRAINTVQVTPAFYQSVTEFYRKMSDSLDEVERVFDNLEVSDAE